MQQKILILDTLRPRVESLRKILESSGFEVIAAYGYGEARSRLAQKVFHMVVFYRSFVEQGQQNLTELLRREAPDAVPVAVWESAPPENLHRALSRRGGRCIAEPVSPEQLVNLIREIAAAVKSRMTVPGKKKGWTSLKLLGESPAMRRLRQTLERVARTEATVLLRGETGAGKELAACYLHAHSARADDRLVAVNCAALPDSLLESELFGHEKGSFTGAHRQKLGKFEFAGGGTLFLDEIGELSPRIQAKLLRVVDDREFERVGGNRTLQVRCRIIAASNMNFEAALSDGRFREDLYYRLNVVSVDLPSLRHRVEDIPQLVRHFIERFSARHHKTVRGLPPRVMQRLMDYPWPGNVRQLENLIERGVILCAGDIIEDLSLPEDPSREAVPPGSAVSRIEQYTLKEMRARILAPWEKKYVERLLEVHGGHVSRSAQMAGVDRKTFYRILREHGIEPARFKHRVRSSRKNEENKPHK